jgi:hypothetical protein
MKHHHHFEAQAHIAPRVMSKEAKKITALVAGLRQSVFDIDKERARAKDASDPALMITLDTRRNNLMVTVAALEDRLSAIQGLLKLNRRHVAHRMH